MNIAAKTPRLIPLRTDVHRHIEAAGRAPVLGWIDDRRVKPTAHVRDTLALIRKTLMEAQRGTQEATQ